MHLVGSMVYVLHYLFVLQIFSMKFWSRLSNYWYQQNDLLLCLIDVG